MNNDAEAFMAMVADIRDKKDGAGIPLSHDELCRLKQKVREMEMTSPSSIADRKAGTYVSPEIIDYPIHDYD